jgi:arginine decarboxylase
MTGSGDELLSDAPLLAAWHSYRGAGPVPFTIPGHKGAAGQLWPALGTVLATDVPLFGGIDTVKLTAGVLADAESRAARLWGGDWCRFSTGGSTHAAQVLALSVGTPGDRVLVSRSAHRSMLSGLVLAGLTPVWLPTTVDDRFGIPSGVSVAAMRDAIEANPSARGVFLVEPSYLGTVSELPALVDVAHAAGLPVLVDQAWGAHFGFHPALPPHALDCDADAMVFSAHKTLPAYSQASVIVARTQRLDRHRLDRAFDMANTTSPAGSILASIDGARALLAARGTELLDRVVSVVARARDCLRDVAGLVVPAPTDFPPGRLDPTRLVLLVAGTGGSGVAVEQDLLHAGIPV